MKYRYLKTDSPDDSLLLISLSTEGDSSTIFISTFIFPNYHEVSACKQFHHLCILSIVKKDYLRCMNQSF